MAYYYSLSFFVGFSKYKEFSDFVGFHGRRSSAIIYLCKIFLDAVLRQCIVSNIVL